MQKRVLLISTLDTKGDETFYLKGRLEARGAECVLMDISMRGKGASTAHILPEAVAQAGGSTLEEVHASKERSRITDITIRGASRIARDLYGQGKLDGVMAVGGSTEPPAARSYRTGNLHCCGCSTSQTAVRVCSA